MLLTKGLVTEDDLLHALRRSESEGLSLGEALVAMGAISVTALEDALLLQQTWRPLGQLLLEHGLVTADELEAALAEQERTGRPLGEVVRRRFEIPAAAIGEILAEQYRLQLETERGFGSGLRQGIDARHRRARDESGTTADDEPDLLLTRRLRRDVEATQPRSGTSGLHAALEAREETIASLGSANQQRVAEIAALRDALAEKDATINELERRLAELESANSPSSYS